MKNKKVKKMMCLLMNESDGYDYEYRHYENQGVKNLSAGVFLMPENESCVVFFGNSVSIKANEVK